MQLYFPRLLLVCVCLFFSFSDLSAYNLRRITHKDGLSNSAILSMTQDPAGYMWFGSCDGLNRYDGIKANVFNTNNANYTLSGNLIENIMAFDDDLIWVLTNYGLNQLNLKTHEIRYYNNFRGNFFMQKGAGEDFFLIKEDNAIMYYHPVSREFKRVEVGQFQFDQISDFAIDSKNIIWLFLKDGREQHIRFEKDVNQNIYFTLIKEVQHPFRIKFASHDGDEVYLIDSENKLYKKNLINQKLIAISNISSALSSVEDISSIIEYHNDFYIGVRTKGLLRLKRSSDNTEIMYMPEWIDINAGVFCLCKDQYQDLFWIGTDGKGVFVYSNDPYSFRSYQFNKLSYDLEKPVRSIFLDHKKTLWIGTKGDGILKVDNFDGERQLHDSESYLFTTRNSNLNSNLIYAFEASRHPILWIGSEEGLNFYSYQYDRIEKAGRELPDIDTIRFVHSVHELNDSVLWVATVGTGIYKINYTYANGGIKIQKSSRYTIQNNERQANYFFTLYKENDSLLWLGNRGYGAFQLNTVTQQLEQKPMNSYTNSQTLNDVFSIIKQGNQLWIGTSFGLVKYFSNDEFQVFNKEHGFPNNTIHGILPGSENMLWLSTNQGIIAFNTLDNSFQIYNSMDGLKTTEFSDGAFFKDPESGVLYFGGIDGLVAIQEKAGNFQVHHPDIHFNALNIYGEEKNIYQYIREQDSKEVLNLNFDNNFFTIGFIAIDYVKGQNYQYEYQLEGYNDKWIKLAKNEVSFTNVKPGNYTLRIRYPQEGVNEGFIEDSLQVCILPPWYLSSTAYWIYSILMLMSCFLCRWLIARWYRLRREAEIARMSEKHKEDLYESKLRFFTNITHELCTPLTLISGPCEKLLEKSRGQGDIYKYSSIIKANVGKLHNLIQDLIEFRRVETDHKPVKIVSAPVGCQLKEIAEAFCDMAETRNIRYELKIDEAMVWQTDVDWFSKITTNLISNAFKYTTDYGHVSVCLKTEEDRLFLSVDNTGAGIPQDKLSEIFDRYQILDHFEGDSIRGISSRNGLGLAICHSFVKLLKGDISVQSIPGKVTTFIVRLPLMPVSELPEEKDAVVRPPAHLSGPDDLPEKAADAPFLPVKIISSDQKAPTILIVDDGKDILDFITDLFADKYNIIAVNDSREVIDILQKLNVDLIIMDVMMPNIDGLKLTRQIKRDKLHSHIPLILLSADNQNESRSAGFDAGADLYMTKPFDIDHLTKVVSRYLLRNDELKEYYNSSFSAFVINNGKYIHQDDKLFFEKFMELIDQNLDNSEMSVDFISAQMGMSSRHLYRKIKTLSDTSPSDIIKEYRLEQVRKLLLTTTLTIDEIIFKTGFSNRGNFFRIFSQKFGVSPRKFRLQHTQEVDKEMA
ncbi:MAG: response regulator [Bacteroidales bacterium]